MILYSTLLSIPRSSLSTNGERAFSIVAPRLWNQLPSHIRNLSSLASFKSNLKTFRSNRHFVSCLLWTIEQALFYFIFILLYHYLLLLLL